MDVNLLQIKIDRQKYNEIQKKMVGESEILSYLVQFATHQQIIVFQNNL